ncbi:hypothetical protein COO60DRAFT_1642040 [Scenedesmus sp. NREL 46B-D3]|nr:hypothetical protein COO60DRAFT_1642040 [Scenedesmus sp. NREL 46B-D3]
MSGYRTDVEALLGELLAAQKAQRVQRKAATQQQRQQKQGLDAVLGSSDGDDSDSSSDSSSGSSSGGGATSLQPVMRDLSGSSGSSSSSSSSSTSDDAGFTAAAAAAAAADGATPPVSGAGAFLLRIPMRELLGVDLEPLLVVYVDIDDRNGQVTFRANRLVIGDPRFDQEFKVDLTANMSSKMTQPATLMTPATAAAPTADSSSSSSSGVAVSATVSSASAAIAAAAGDGSASAVKQQQQQQQQPLAVAEAADAGAAVPETEATAAAVVELAPAWQRTSSLACKVKLSMTLRMPHPLSIVPGPLLSTTAGLVAKLVMQALLPSFLELLATDYARWAAGSSTQARQALPAGSLVAAGKQQLQQSQERQQQQQPGVLPAQQ